MAGILWSDSPYGLLTFILITLVLGGLGAWASGRAMAQTWRPMPMIALYMLVLTAGIRFLHYALYGEKLLSVHYLHCRLCLDDRGRRLRLPADARRPDGDAIFVGLRAGRAELARQGQRVITRNRSG